MSLSSRTWPCTSSLMTRFSGISVMWSVWPSNMPWSTMMMVPSCPRIRPGMCCELAIDELSTSEWPLREVRHQVERVRHLALVLEHVDAARRHHAVAGTAARASRCSAAPPRGRTGRWRCRPSNPNTCGSGRSGRRRRRAWAPSPATSSSRCNSRPCRPDRRSGSMSQFHSPSIELR